MRIGLCSDLHLEFGYQPNIVPPEDIDLMIFAGDIHVGVQAFDWIEAQNFSCPSLYVAGNHEFYNFVHGNLLARMHARSSEKVIFLEDATYEQGGYTFIGATLWTDYEFHRNMPVEINMANAESNLRDHLVIHKIDGEHVRRWKAEDAREINAVSRTFIRREVEKAGRDKSIVVTHHGPSTVAIGPRFAGDPLNGCFSNDYDEWILDHGPRAWLWGHTHWDVYREVGDTLLATRQHGYRNERAATGQPPFELLVIDLPDAE